MNVRCVIAGSKTHVDNNAQSFSHLHDAHTRRAPKQKTLYPTLVLVQVMFLAFSAVEETCGDISHLVRFLDEI